jgi:hypothetical protein
VSVLMHATSLGSAPVYIVSSVTTSARASHTDDLSKERVDVVRHVRPLALVRVIEVSFDSSEFVRLADAHVKRTIAHLVIHTFISASTSSRDRLLASPSELPQRYVHGSSSARSVSRGFRVTAPRDYLTMFGTECSSRHRLVGRKRELCAGGHGWIWC